MKLSVINAVAILLMLGLGGCAWADRTCLPADTNSPCQLLPLDGADLLA